MKEVEYELVCYRDAGLPTYTYFWITKTHNVYGPYFETEQDAIDWLNNLKSEVKNDLT